MDDICTYYLEVRNGVDVETFNATSPLEVMVVRVDPAATLLTVCADQSGFIGLLRHFHQQGFLLLSVYRQQRAG